MKVKRLSKQGNMILMENPSLPKGEEWFFLAPPVAGFAKTFKGGEDIEFDVEDRAGENTITFIRKDGVSGGAKKETTASGFKCIKCGTKLKDDKYEMCYDCNTKARKEEASSPEGKAKQDSIERQAILKASAQAVATAMQGQVDVNALGEQIIALYDRLLTKFRQ